MSPQPRPFTLGPPQPVAPAQFALQPGRDPAVCTVELESRPAVRRDLQLDGRAVAIVLPAAIPARQSARWAERLARAIATLPTVAARKVTTVVAHVGPNPSDACWRRKTGSRTLQAGMTADGTGRISVFGRGFRQSDDALARNIYHEIGHTLSMGAWGADPAAAPWQPWRAAIGRDPAVPSAYGNGRAPSKVLEDFAEASALYLLTSLRPAQRARFRQQMPARFALLDKMWQTTR